jgi:hypothetical protein
MHTLQKTGAWPKTLPFVMKTTALCRKQQLIYCTGKNSLQRNLTCKRMRRIQLWTRVDYKTRSLENISLAEAGFTPEKLIITIDSIANDAISKKAMPGCVLLVTRNGKIVLEKTYGHYTYEKRQPVTFMQYSTWLHHQNTGNNCFPDEIYDEGKLDLKKTFRLSAIG